MTLAERLSFIETMERFDRCARDPENPAEIARTIEGYLLEKGRRKGHEEGRREGLEEGRQEGYQEGRVATLRSQLLYKFGDLDAASETRLQVVTPEMLDLYIQRVLTAGSLATVFED